jgi:hypothetical protein
MQAVTVTNCEVDLARRVWQLAVNLPPHLRVFAVARCIHQSCSIYTDIDSWDAVLRWSCEAEDFGKLASKEWSQALKSSLRAVLTTCCGYCTLESSDIQLKRWASLAYVFCVRSRKLRKRVVLLTNSVCKAEVLAALRSCIRNLECKNVRVWCHSLKYQVLRGWRPCHDVPRGTFEMIAQRRCQSMAAVSCHPQAWTQVSVDVLRAVMRFFRPRALCRIASVCKVWNVAVGSCPVWSTLYAQRYGGITLCEHAATFKVSVCVVPPLQRNCCQSDTFNIRVVSNSMIGSACTCVGYLPKLTPSPLQLES